MGNFDMRFPRSRLEFSIAAINKGIDNTIPLALLSNAGKLSRTLARIEANVSISMGRPVRLEVSSAFRAPELNALLGGTSSDTHKKALAADIQVAGLQAHELVTLIQSGPTDFDQCVNQFQSWVRIEVAAGELKGCRTVLTASFDKNSKGLPAVIYQKGNLKPC